MAITYLKKAAASAQSDQSDTRDMVSIILSDIRAEGDAAALRYASRFDRWEGPTLVSPDDIARAVEITPEAIKADIRFAHDNIRRFAEAQKATLTETELEIQPGFWVGQRNIPMRAAGCYVPGGRYSHIASALMTITTARVAGVSHVMACSPPKPGSGIPAPILYAMDLCGADHILNMGGVQAVAAMAFGQSVRGRGQAHLVW